MIATHIGYKRASGNVHSGRLFSHSNYAGKRHAICTEAIYTGAQCQTLCGETIVVEHDGEKFNVWKTETMVEVSCKRCRKLVEKG